MSAPFELRAIGARDLPYLFSLYASTRTTELELVDWSAEQKHSFLEQQFAAQHHHYQTHYAGASFDLVVVDDRPVGRCYVARLPDEIRLVDVIVDPGERGRGIGTALVRWLLAEGERSGQQVTIHVERFNPALRLYQRLGFEPRGERGPYLLLAWQPPIELRRSGAGTAVSPAGSQAQVNTAS